MKDDEHGVINAWVKSSDVYNRQRESWSPSVASARRAYQDLLTDPDITFAQFGANTVEGPIVLGEYRPAQSGE